MRKKWLLIGVLTGTFKEKRLREAWEQFASEIGAEFSWERQAKQNYTKVLLGEILTNDFEGWPVSLKYRKETRPSSGGQHGQSTTETHVVMTAHHQSKDDFSFSIQRKSSLHKLFRFIVKPGIYLGYPDIDRDFKVLSNDQPKVKALFAKERIRQLIQYLPSTTMKRTPRLATGAMLSFATKDSIKDSKQLRHLFELFAEILNSLHDAGLAEREV